MAFMALLSRCNQLFVLALITYIQAAEAFGVVQHSRVPSRAFTPSRQAPDRTSLLLAAADPSAAAVAETNDEASLVLRADYVGESKPAPITSQETMTEFFRDPKHCACLISAGNTRESHTVQTTDELLKKWKSRAASLGGEQPEMTDYIISVRTGGIRFPGVTVVSTSLIGSKLLTDLNGFPNYEFTLIQDKREATGLRPIVWVYSQLTGAGVKERENDAAPLSLSRVTPCPDGESVTFKIDSFLEIRVKFPAVLLKIMPVSKEKAEAQGAEAVIKVLKKDINVSIEKFRDIYAETLQV